MDKVALRALTTVSTPPAANHFPGQLWPPAVNTTMSWFFVNWSSLHFHSGQCFRSTFQNVIFQGLAGQKERCSTGINAATLNGGRSRKHQIVFPPWEVDVGQNPNTQGRGKRTQLNFMSPLLINTVWAPSSRCIHWAFALQQIDNTLVSSPGCLLSLHDVSGHQVQQWKHQQRDGSLRTDSKSLKVFPSPCGGSRFNSSDKQAARGQNHTRPVRFQVWRLAKMQEKRCEKNSRDGWD